MEQKKYIFTVLFSEFSAKFPKQLIEQNVVISVNDVKKIEYPWTKIIQNTQNFNLYLI